MKEEKWVERYAARLTELGFLATRPMIESLGRALFAHWKHELPEEVAEWTHDNRLPKPGQGSRPEPRG